MGSHLLLCYLLRGAIKKKETEIKQDKRNARGSAVSPELQIVAWRCRKKLTQTGSRKGPPMRVPAPSFTSIQRFTLREIRALSGYL